MIRISKSNNKKFNDIVKEILKKKNKFIECEFLYYYTNLHVLKLILENSTLQFTERNLFNDVNDEKLAALGIAKPKNKQYAFCTTTIRDSVHNWMCYGNKEDSFCIVFDRKKLIKYLYKFYYGLEENSRFFYGPVQYFEKEELDQVKQYIYSKCNITCNKKLTKLIDNYFYSLIKQKGHSCEHEYRFVYQTERKPSFRESKGMCIPYQKISIPSEELSKKWNDTNIDNKLLPIEEIMIGPMNQDNTTIENLAMFINQTNYRLLNIEISHAELNMRW